MRRIFGTKIADLSRAGLRRANNCGIFADARLAASPRTKGAEMQFLVVAYDDTDEKALGRRMLAREAHLKAGKEMYDSGRWLYAAGIMNDDGKLIGSMIVCDFPSRKELDDQWLKNEPYVVGRIWKTIQVTRAQVAPFCTNKTQ